MRISKRDDIIICWFDLQAVICFLLCKILFKKRQIIALNIMLKFNRTLKGRVYAHLYRWALSSKHFFASVQSNKYGNLINANLNIVKEYEIIHDPNLTKYYIKNPNEIEPIPKSVFMGGASSRDWDFGFQLASQMPDIKFIFVMTEFYYKKYSEMKLENITLLFDIPKDKFNQLAFASSVVIMPTNTEAPAGLMLLFFSAANEKLYITNHTATSQEYINNERGVIIPKDVNLWIDKIRFYIDHPDDAKVKGKKLRQFIEKECTADKFISGIKRICSKIENSNI